MANQNDQKTKGKEVKEIKVLSSSQTRLDLIVTHKNTKQKESNNYETVLMDDNSSETKCSFSISKFFNNPKSHFFG